MSRVLRTVGELLITAGVVILLFVVYELYITDLFAAHRQAALHHQLERVWDRPAPLNHRPDVADAVALGQGLAVLRIPRLGRHYEPVIVEGVSTDDLQHGPGHYPGTALPGGVGNFVVSGHRTTWGRPFFNLDQVRAGDAVVVETRDEWFVYRVTSTEVVAPDDVAVIAPVPDRPGVVPTARMLTFTTCNPRYSAAQRLIVHGVLASMQPKSSGEPAALSTGVA